MGHLLRTRLGKDIVAEFLVPTRRHRKQKVVLLYGGAPSVPEKEELIVALSKCGYWVFFSRLRGSWESDGEFLEHSPEEDVYIALNALSAGFRDLFSGERYMLSPDAVFLVGSSFGGPAALLASKDDRVSASVALSPVIDWRDEVDEPFEELYRFTQEAFGGAYRGPKRNWNKLLTGQFYSPAAEAEGLPGDKMHIIQAENDRIVPVESADRFVKQTGAQYIRLRRGGHLGLSSLLKRAHFTRLLTIFSRYEN